MMMMTMLMVLMMIVLMKASTAQRAALVGPSWAILGHLGRADDPRPGRPDPRGGPKGKMGVGRGSSLDHNSPRGLVGLMRI